MVNIHNFKPESTLSNISEENVENHGSVDHAFNHTIIHKSPSEISFDNGESSIADDSQEDESSFIDENDETDDESFNGVYDSINMKKQEHIPTSSLSLFEQIKEAKGGATLNKISIEDIEKDKAEKEKIATNTEGNTLLGAISAAINARRDSIRDSDSESESKDSKEGTDEDERLYDEDNDEQEDDNDDDENAVVVNEDIDDEEEDEEEEVEEDEEDEEEEEEQEEQEDLQIQNI